MTAPPEWFTDLVENAIDCYSNMVEDDPGDEWADLLRSAFDIAWANQPVKP